MTYESVIQAARAQAMRSPCEKSKRGAVVFDPVTRGIHGRGFNHQPRGFACDGSPACMAACGKLCIHAEEMALRRAALDTLTSSLVSRLELVHVKVLGDRVVPGGGPSCWQCSRLVVEAGIKGVWLFEVDEGPRGEATDRWRFYLSADFHRLTLKHERNKLPVIEER